MQNNYGLEHLSQNNGVSWKTLSGSEILIDAPTFVVKNPGEGDNLVISPKLISHSQEKGGVVLNYQLSSDQLESSIIGTYNVFMELSKDSNLLVYDAELSFNPSFQWDVTIQNHFKIKNISATKMIAPERDGYLRSYPLSPGEYGLERYKRGAGSSQIIEDMEPGRPIIGPVQSIPSIPASYRFNLDTRNELGIPVIGLELPDVNHNPAKSVLAVSMDPYCGGVFQTFSDQEQTSIIVSTTYLGSTIPLSFEKRKLVLEFVSTAEDDLIRSFYQTIPEIKPGAQWIHDIHLVYYDYLSDGGEGWFKGLQYLADRIPEEYRDRVAVCLHGWYDYFQQYAYDHSSGELLEEWIAFPGSRKIKMSLEEMHRRLNFSNELGFRTLLYFADGTNSDSGAPGFHPEWVIRDKDGNTIPGWKGPDSVGDPLRMDPAVPALREWYKDYLKALLEEYSGAIDGLVWDETHYSPVDSVSYTLETPAYSDRAMFSLISELTQIVQEYQKQNPNLVFLVADNGTNTNALVAHGTYQDSDMDPYFWGPSMFSNYRNHSWSCNWNPVSSVDRSVDTNGYAAELGFPQGLSNGYSDDLGPHEMPKDILAQVLERFLINVKNNKQRVRYLNHKLNGNSNSTIHWT
jgi:hypothetical protein